MYLTVHGPDGLVGIADVRVTETTLEQTRIQAGTVLLALPLEPGVIPSLWEFQVGPYKGLHITDWKATYTKNGASILTGVVFSDTP